VNEEERMAGPRKTLLEWIERDRDRLIDFYRGFIQAKSPNPPGDTREAVAHICGLLDAEKLPYRIIAPQPDMPNVVGTFECGAPGRHLVLNGHIDVFPVGSGEDWTHGPWSGALVDGKIYGRGACDMKCGTTASIFTFYYIHRLRDQLKGRLTLTCVSDEETMGPWGARYLMEHHPEVHGDCLLNGEPSSPFSIRFGEKGPLWIEITVRTKGAHGAYTHASPSATKIAARLIGDLEALAELPVSAPDNVLRALEQAAGTIDRAQGKGAAKIVPKVTVNIGIIRAGLKVNMVPGECVLEVDIRLPVGITSERVLAEVDSILRRYPEASYRVINHQPPNWCEPFGEMVEILRLNAKELGGYEPEPIVSLGGTDARLWRYRNVPAYVYGPAPRNMGSADECVPVEEFLHIVRTHVLSAYDYLSRAEAPHI
jgi:succinyl-diaminopimelate desuccinylase